MNITQLIKGFSHILMPRMCRGCDRALTLHESILCLDCVYHLPQTDFHIDGDNESARQLWGKLNFEKVTSMLYLSKSSCVELLLHRLKFKGFPEIGVFLGEKYSKLLLQTFSTNKPDFIFPIPLHPSKQRKRGYNQAECFAIGLASGMKVPLRNDILIRILLSESQVTMARIERYDNVAHAFSVVSSPNFLVGKHILLVDDVLTTGATVSAAGNLLTDAGAKVSIATIARA